MYPIIKGVTGHQGTPMEIRREDKCLRFQPGHDRQSLRLLCYVVILKGIRKVSVQVIIIVVFPLKEKDFAGFIVWLCGGLVLLCTVGFIGVCVCGGGLAGHRPEA